MPIVEETPTADVNGGGGNLLPGGPDDQGEVTSSTVNIGTQKEVDAEGKTMEPAGTDSSAPSLASDDVAAAADKAKGKSTAGNVAAPSQMLQPPACPRG